MSALYGNHGMLQQVKELDCLTNNLVILRIKLTCQNFFYQNVVQDTDSVDNYKCHTRYKSQNFFIFDINIVIHFIYLAKSFM